MAELEVRIDGAGGDRVVAVAGEIDLDSAPRLRDTLRRELTGKPALTVDLRAVSYIDSSGVAVLIQVLKQAGKSGAQLRLREPSDAVMAVLDLAQLTQLFEIERAGRDR